MAGELGSRDSPSPPGDYRFYAHDGRKFAFHAAPNLSIQPPLPPSGLFCSSPAMQRPALGTTLWSPSRPGDSWRHRDGCFCHLGSLARGRLPSAGVIVVELVLLVLADRLDGPPLEGYPWEVKTGLRLDRTPGLEERHYLSGVWAELFCGR